LTGFIGSLITNSQIQQINANGGKSWGPFSENPVEAGVSSNDIGNDLVTGTTAITYEDYVAEIRVRLVWLNAHETAFGNPDRPEAVLVAEDWAAGAGYALTTA